MEPQSTAVAIETEDQSSNPESVQENISRYVKEHEVSATRRNMHIHQDEEDDDGSLSEE